MRAVVTRVNAAAVRIDGEVRGQIDRGYLILLGIAPQDTEADATRLAEKIVHLRVFSDAAGKMNLALEDVGGALLVVSQFTLYADLSSRRPGFSRPRSPRLPSRSTRVSWHIAALWAFALSTAVSAQICRSHRSMTGL
mgnify:CR=1 FL=1